jgi:catechol 2,3-dioxygenase-like lactoylglutathione lyase family enzyme
MSVSSLVPMAFVKSVARSIDFYEKLGFVVGNTSTAEGATEPHWVSLTSGGADLMLAKATAPVDPDEQAVLFYLYCDDIVAFRNKLLQSGVEASPVQHPFYAPRGEFRVKDPDGYCLMVTYA